MLVNGKEVISREFAKREQGSLDIQKDLNNRKDVPQDLKAEVDPNYYQKFLDQLSGDNSHDSMNIMFDGQSFADNADYASRTQRYTLFREMDTMEFIHRGLELIAEDASKPTGDGEVFKVYSDNEEVKDCIEKLFEKKINLEDELFSMIYETIKMGYNFYEIVPDNWCNPKTIKRVRYLEPEKLERIEINGKLTHFVYRRDAGAAAQKKQTNVLGFNVSDTVSDKDKEPNLYKLFPWQIIHFKLENKDTLPYGGSVLLPGARTYKRLVLLEDIMLVYRISRAPERRVFYVDVGNLNPVEAKRFLTKLQNNYRTQPYMDENGNINRKANVMSITQDIFIPISEGRQNTKIDTLQPGTAMGQGEDPLLTYFRDKILKTMNIPPQFLGDNTDRSRSLAQLDVKYGRYVQRIQSQVIKGLNKIAALELFFKGFKKEDLHNFRIELTPPSNVNEITEIDLFTQKMNLVSQVQALNIFSLQWILKNILHFNDKEIADIIMQKKLEAGFAQPGMDGGMGGGAGGMPPVGADAGMGGAGAMPPAGVDAGVNPQAGGAGPDQTAMAAMGGGQQQITASTLINMFGKEFLVENKNDFFKIVSYIKEQESHKENPILESVTKYMLSTVEGNAKKKKIRNNVESQFITNEFKGLNFEDDSIKVYETKFNKSVNDYVFEETEVFIRREEYITEEEED